MHAHLTINAHLGKMYEDVVDPSVVKGKFYVTSPQMSAFRIYWKKRALYERSPE